MGDWRWDLGTTIVSGCGIVNDYRIVSGYAIVSVCGIVIGYVIVNGCGIVIVVPSLG